MRTMNVKKISSKNSLDCSRSVDDKNIQLVIEKIQNFISREKIESKCQAEGFDPNRFIIYKEAFDILIDEMTSYKDILCDIKREYEECINLLENSLEEKQILQSKLFAVAAVKATLVGYTKRKDDLYKKFNILKKENERLEIKIQEIKLENKRKDKPEENNVTAFDDTMEQQTYEFKAPVPGLPVADWCNEKVMKDAIKRVQLEITEVIESRKKCSVPLCNKLDLEAILAEKVRTKENYLNLVDEAKASEEELKEAFLMCKGFVTSEGLKSARQVVAFNNLNVTMNESGAELVYQNEFMDNDEGDLWSEKEAEWILEYIDRFFELFEEKSYSAAAIYAANSPRAVMRNMEVMRWFDEASKNWSTSPSPLLMFVTALMKSSGGHNKPLDEEMSIFSCRCVLDENHPELIRHWTEIKAFTFCSEIGDMMFNYSKKMCSHRVVCLDVALQMYTANKDHFKVCLTLHTLGQIERLITYAHGVKFKTADYLNLISILPNEELLLKLYQPKKNECYKSHKNRAHISDFNSNSESRLEIGLPIRMDEAICTLIRANQNEVALKLLQKLFEFSRGNQENKRIKHFNEIFSYSNARVHSITSLYPLDQVVYIECESPVSDEDSIERPANENSWWKIANFCRDSNQRAIEEDIRSALSVKCLILKCIIDVDLDERSEFDYYN